MRFYLRPEDMAHLAAGLTALSAGEVFRQVRAHHRDFDDVPDDVLRAAIAEIERRTAAREDVFAEFRSRISPRSAHGVTP